jgi:hypothetical protein
MKIFILRNHISGEAPTVLTLDHKIQGSIELTIQSLNITLTICFSHTIRRRLNRDDILRSDNLSIITDTCLSIPEQGLDDSLLVAKLIANLEFVIPRLGTLSIVDTQLLGHCALALLDLDVPV